jgi:hypothetical protein
MRPFPVQPELVVRLRLSAARELGPVATETRLPIWVNFEILRKSRKFPLCPQHQTLLGSTPRLTDDNHVRLNSLPSDAQQRLASGDMESMPSGETGIPRPDMSSI